MTRIILERTSDELDVSLGKAKNIGELKMRIIAEIDNDSTATELLEMFVDLAVGYGYARESMTTAIDEYIR
jgi:hypothetical protein